MCVVCVEVLPNRVVDHIYVGKMCAHTQCKQTNKVVSFVSCVCRDHIYDILGIIYTLGLSKS